MYGPRAGFMPRLSERRFSTSLFNQGSFPMGTTGNGVPTLILAMGTPFPYLFEFRILNKQLDGFRDFVNIEERNP